MFLAGIAWTVQAQSVDATLQAKIDEQVKSIKAIASDPVVVNAVKHHNSSLSPEKSAMSQDKWKSLSMLEPFVRSFTKNEAGAFLKSKKTDVYTEAFISGADGLKIAFLSKTSSWSHKGKAKHDDPMTGKTWQGAIELDESTGLQQIQVGVPVLDGDKPIGSLVVGLSISKLK
jgi:hypothetical protein